MMQAQTMQMNTILFNEDFCEFPVGQLPHDYTPEGEYHCKVPGGHMGRWTELTTHYSWRNALGWWVGENNGCKFLDHAVERKKIPSLLVTGTPWLDDITIQADVTRTGRAGSSGVAFRLQNSQQYYALLIDGNHTVSMIKADFDNTITILNSAPLPPDLQEPLRLVVNLQEDTMTAVVNNMVEICASDNSYGQGQIGLVAWGPIRYHRVVLSANQNGAAAMAQKESEHRHLTATLVEKLPSPVLWRKFDLGDAGAGRSIRFGDLDNDGEIEVLMVQCIERGGTDNIASISCLTAFKLNGDILWQVGEPNPRHGIVTADLPVQTHDINGDGRLEVVLCKDFMIQVLDGRTGKLIREAPTPLNPPAVTYGSPDDLYRRLSGDTLFFADLSGRGSPCEILVKNRYGKIWALDTNLEVLWYHECKTGHSPLVCDINSDGRDEVLIGSTLLNANGETLWHLETSDHVDTSAFLRLRDNADPVVLLACSDDGLFFLRTDGSLIRCDLLGHTQDLSVGRFRSDKLGMQFWTKSFWGHPGILFLYDSNLERIITVQGYPLGSQVYPIDWDGSDTNHILLSAHPHLGGLMDGYGRRIPIFVDDGHPWLCCEPLDVTGDGRDEVLCWDLDQMWIYTQSRASSRQVPKSLQPHRYNFTNYGCHIGSANASVPR